MAVVTRRYIFFGIGTFDLPDLVDPSASVINGSRAWQEVQYDDAAKPGITVALDEFMAKAGFIFDDDAGKGGIRVRAPDGTIRDIVVEADGTVGSKDGVTVEMVPRGAPAVADPIGGVVIDVVGRTTIVALLNSLRATGVILP